MTGLKVAFMWAVVASGLFADYPRLLSSDLEKMKSLSGKNDWVQLVVQDTYESASFPKTEILETCSVGPCVAVALYDSKKQLGVLGHFSAGTTIPQSVQKMLDPFTERNNVSASIAGGLKVWSGTLNADLEKELKKQSIKVDVAKGPFEHNAAFKCVRLHLKTGDLELLDDPNIGWMPVIREKGQKELVRMRDAKLFVHDRALPAEKTDRKMLPPYEK